ncbi:hypothetical protein ACFVVM_16620 [Nocardia sp. NPDC058176]|uniref:hypothetical protein n=1 Tax=Nocardia sp. NPDC058176 TaxID=3346368 RepID=UPI0036DBD19C
MARRIPSHVKGERVRMALLDAQPDGLSAKRLSDVTGLSPSQVRAGLAEIREEAALANSEPLIWSRARGYQISVDPDLIRVYTGSVTGTSHKRVVRLMKGTVLPFAQVVPGGPWVDLAMAQLNAAAASLQMASDVTADDFRQRSRTAGVAR